jgi:hypothetical protein
MIRVDALGGSFPCKGQLWIIRYSTNASIPSLR